MRDSTPRITGLESNLMATTEQFSSESEQGPFSPPATRATFIFIVVTVALDFLAFGIIAPVLPNLIKQFEGGNMARGFGMTGYFGLCLGDDAVFVFAGSGRVDRSVWTTARYSDFLPRAGA